MGMENTRTGDCVKKAMCSAWERASLYRVYAKKAKAEGYLQLSDLFNETANREQEHGGLLFEILHGCRMPDTLENLEDALRLERAQPYGDYARQAIADGYTGTGDLFEKLGTISESHALRFQTLAEQMHAGAVFSRPEPCLWVCRICGGQHEGCYAPQVCPVCGFPQSCFSLYVRDY